MLRQTHWDRVYDAKAPTVLTWYQERPNLSLALIKASGISQQQTIIDVGGGTSTLTACLLDEGFRHLIVLDISATALQKAQSQLASRAALVQWIQADVTNPDHSFTADLWHDRAVFHFLTDAADRSGYVSLLEKTISPGGHVIIATFGLDGPEKCSGLDIVRYDAQLLSAELGPKYALQESCIETHVTPWNSTQEFIYCRYKRVLA